MCLVSKHKGNKKNSECNTIDDTRGQTKDF